MSFKPARQGSGSAIHPTTPSRWWRRGIGIGPTLAFFFITLVVLTAVLAPWIAPHDPMFGNLGDRLLPPAWFNDGNSEYLLGTDSVGRDEFSRLIFGARSSLAAALAGLLFAAAVGIPIGLIGGYYGPPWPTIVSAAVDISLSLPAVLIAMALALAIGPGFAIVLLVLGLVFWARFARLVRAEVLSLRNRDYVTYSRMMGAPSRYILTRHVLPQLAPTLSVFGSLVVGEMILVEAALSFLGVGMPPPNPSWGNMVSDSREIVTFAWWLAVLPGSAIALVVLSANTIGDWLKLRLDPRRGSGQ